MKPLPLAPLLLLLLLGGGWLLLARMAAPARPDEAPAPTSTSTTSGPRNQAATDQVRVSALSEHSHDQEPAPRPIRLRIVDRNGVPVADADIVFTDEARRDQESAPASAMTRRSDREGFVDLQALPCEPLRAEARKGTLHGTLTFDPTDWAVPDNVLVVDDGKDLHLLVVDDQDRPQPEIRVLIEALTRPPDEADCWQRIAALESDDRGLAVAPDVHDVAYWPVEGHRHLRATIAMLGVLRTPLALRLDDVGTTPITLRCPGNGRLHIRKWEQPGVRSTIETKVLVRESDRDEHVGHWRIERRLPEDVLVAPVGRDWRIRTELHGEVFVRGPRSAGEVVFVDLHEQRRTWFVLHVQGADGAPLAHHRLVEPWELNDYVSDWTTDAEGRLRLPHHFHSVAENTERSWLVADASGRPVGVVAWALPKCDEEPARDIDLGAVRIQPLARRITGVVVDAGTKLPIARASYGGRTAGADLPPQRTDVHGRFELLVVAGAPLQVFASAPGHAATHLEFPGDTNDLELTMHLAAEAAHGATRPAQPTAASSLGAARITVLHDPVVSSAQWELVRCRNEVADDVSAGVGERPTTRAPGHLTFLVRGQEPATYRAAVVDLSSKQTLGRLAPIRIHGGRLSDGEGLTLDLRSNLQDARCQLRRASTGEPTEALFFLDAPQAGERFVEASCTEEFRATLPLGIELPLIVVPENGLPARGVLRGGRTQVDWSEPPTCTVVVHGLPEGLPSDRLRVQPFLLTRNEPLLDELALAGSGGARFAASTSGLSSLRSRADEELAQSCAPADLVGRAGTLQLRWRGRYAFLLQVRNDDGDWNTLYERTPEHVDISVGGPQTIELVVDAARVRALL